MEKNDALLPDHPFCFNGGGDNSAGINYSDVDEESIRKGIEIWRRV